MTDDVANANSPSYRYAIDPTVSVGNIFVIKANAKSGKLFNGADFVRSTSKKRSAFISIFIYFSGCHVESDRSAMGWCIKGNHQGYFETMSKMSNAHRTSGRLHAYGMHPSWLRIWMVLGVSNGVDQRLYGSSLVWIIIIKHRIFYRLLINSIKKKKNDNYEMENDYLETKTSYSCTRISSPLNGM